VKKSIVGKCPICGAPIYGNKEITEKKPKIIYSCDCHIPKSHFAGGPSGQ